MFASYNPAPRPSRPVTGRKVFENAMVAHVWAQQTQSEGRSGNGNFYFRDSTIYSYGGHFPIARFSTSPGLVWFTNRSYSISTGGHIRYTESALRGLDVQIVYVDDPSIRFENGIDKATRDEIELRILARNDELAWDAFQRAVKTPQRKWPGQIAAIERVGTAREKAAAKALRDKIKHARDTIDNPRVVHLHGDANPATASEWSCSDYARAYDRARSDIAKAVFALSRQPNKSKADATRVKRGNKLAKEHAANRDKWTHRANVARQNYAAAVLRNEIDDALKDLATPGMVNLPYWYSRGTGDNHATCTEPLNHKLTHALAIGYTPEQLAPLIEILQQRFFYAESDRDTEEAIRIRTERRYGKSSNRVTRDEWQNGKGNASQYFDGATLLRRKGDTLETSRGASCPFNHAVVAFLRAQDCRANGVTWHRNGHTIRVGVFSVDSIDTQGNLKAGCHTLAWSEMLRLAIKEVPHLVKPSFGLPVVV